MPETRDFREALSDGNVILLDGAMGTELYRRGVFINRSYDDLCRSDPDLVRAVHREYRDAGAGVLETNSFGANRFQLQSYGLEGEVESINAAAAKLAREVARDRFVAGSIGPLGIRLEPYGPTSRAEAREAFREQAAALAAGGADLLSLETFSDPSELAEAVTGAREACGLPVLAQMTIEPEGETTYGARPERFATELAGRGADAVGLNCSVGPALMLEAIRDLAEATSLPVTAVPNAGLPKDIQGRKMYLASPDYMAGYARKLVEAGARIVGGCCGTEPRHIRAMARRLENVVAEGRDGAAVSVPVTGRQEPRPAGPAETEAGSGRAHASVAGRRPAAGTPAARPAREERSAWIRNLEAGRNVTSVELVPPRGADPGRILEAGRRLRAAGVDAVSVPDGARGGLRMAAIATAALVQREVGIETIAHYTCRDRNLLGMASDLLGAEALGLRNLLLITGDPPRKGPYPDSTAVFDIDSIGLTNLVARLNRGEDLAGNPVGGGTSFAVGVGVNPGAMDPERELERWYWKVDAGAEFGVTQPIFDPSRLEDFLDRIERAGTRIPIVAGLWPLTGVRDAEFLTHEVPGIDVPAETVARMRDAEAGGAEAARREGVTIARELLERIRPLSEGVQISARSGEVGPALELLDTGEGAKA